MLDSFTDKDKLQSLFNQAPALIALLIGREGVVTLANESFKSFFGNRSIIGKDMREAYPEIEGQGYFELVEHVFDTEEAVFGKERKVAIDRHLTGKTENAYVNFVFQPFKDENDQTIGVLIHGFEVTDAVLARKELKQQAKLLATVMDNASLALFLMDENQHCTFMNYAAEEMTGFKLEEVRGAPLHTFVHHTKPDGSPYPLLECPIDRALPKNIREHGEEIFVHKDGSFYPVAFTASPIVKNGTPVGTVIEARDLTSEREAALALKKNEERLAFLAMQRDNLKKLNEVKGEFISLASHQLRTPATGVKQYIGMLLEGYAGDLNEDQKLMATTAYESNERQIQIVNDLLKVANIDAGKVTLQKRNIDINKLLQSIIDEQKTTFASRQQTVTLSIPKTECEALLDEERIRMVLENIIDNASKYTPEGKSIIVSVKCTKKSISIAIRDQGVGIAERDINKLFKKFTRISNPLSNSVGGSGLGLYWAKKIIDLHSGTIDIKSTIGKGSTFTVRLPK